MNLWDIEVVTLSGKRQTMADYRGQYLLILNVASQCGFTPQYEGLQKLYDAYRDSGLVVMGFPCDQFGGQEPGAADEIQSFCSLNYGVTFPMFAKIEVNGDDAHPLFQYLKRAKKGFLGTEAIKWNFTKFLVDAEGHVLERYAPTDTPEMIERDLKTLLKV